ncbi:MAG: hypothetical protein IJW82_03420 [Clostridia bacterium]|nr:hypothetical protein [Clostridia bacterium]
MVNHTILERKTSNINFLQGRMVTKDITNFLGEIIIKKNTIITKSHIEKAKKFYKVRELIYFSKPISA